MIAQELRPLLKMAEVAEILQISPRQAYRLAKIGELPAIRFSKKVVRVRAEDLERYIQEHLGAKSDDPI